MAKLKEGNVGAASELFQRAVSVTPSMAHQLILILSSENIEFVVAPYEADAQLAYLSSLEEERGGIVAVISEDSDLLAYGCAAIIFKMDRYGTGEEMVLREVLDAVARVPSFQNFNEELFTGMCVLAGCDFLPSVPGIGIAKAYNLVSKYRNLDRVLSVLKLEKGNQMPKDYTKAFREAVAVFNHARMYVNLEQKPTLEERNQKLEIKYMNEDVVLEKLIFPLNNETKEEKSRIPDKNLLKVPDNNPFKKRKLDEAHFDRTESVIEEVSVVTKVDNSEIVCLTPKSQGSVESKPIEMTDGKGRRKSEKKSKRSNCHSSGNKKSSILNFFSRV
ncbi:unnamed protein product [Ilex paraguariensis]|uniref:Exonuclease 1 n=1 Tax=Ilex paraguariensis TaxID=185542 RepID=A0ABC8TTX0_9AQUA